MKVAFWSNGRGRSCVTSNLACISVLSAFDCPTDRTIIFENHNNIMNLGTTLLNHHSVNEIRESITYSSENGLHRVLQSMEQGKEVSEELLYRQAQDYLGKRLLYLPSESDSADCLEYYLDKVAIRAMDCFEKYSDMVLVDTTSAPLASSRKILQKADIVVVNLSQNEQLLNHFFRNYSSIQERAFYLVGNYDAASELTRSAIVKKYHLRGNQVGMIPHNIEFSDAISKGQVIPYLWKHYECRQEDSNYEFMTAAKEAVSLFRATVRKVRGKTK